MVAFTPTIQGMIELVVYKTGTDESKIDTHVDPEKILLSKETVFFSFFFLLMNVIHSKIVPPNLLDLLHQVDSVLSHSARSATGSKFY